MKIMRQTYLKWKPTNTYKALKTAHQKIEEFIQSKSNSCNYFSLFAIINHKRVIDWIKEFHVAAENHQSSADCLGNC